MKKTIPQRIKNQLRKYRKARGLTQEEVALILGVKSGSVVSRWENGLCIPKLHNTIKLALLYRTMADALFIDLRRSLKDEIAVREKKILTDETRK